jgi:hypothetical protein
MLVITGGVDMKRGTQDHDPTGTQTMAYSPRNGINVAEQV